MKQAYHHKDLRNALIEEALTLLATDGSSEVTLRELARRLGVTHTAPYAHFTDKRALLEAVADHGFGRLANELETAASSTQEPLQAFRAIAQTYLRFAQENPNLYRLMFSDAELADDPECEMSPEGEHAFEIVLRVVSQMGLPPGSDVRDVAAAAWSMVHGISMLDIDRRINGKTMTSPQAVLSLATEMMIRGLR